MIVLDKSLGKLTLTQFKKWLKGRKFKDLDATKLYKSVGGKIKDEAKK